MRDSGTTQLQGIDLRMHTHIHIHIQVQIQIHIHICICNTSYFRICIYGHGICADTYKCVFIKYMHIPIVAEGLKGHVRRIRQWNDSTAVKLLYPVVGQAAENLAEGLGLGFRFRSQGCAITREGISVVR